MHGIRNRMVGEIVGGGRGTRAALALAFLALAPVGGRQAMAANAPSCLVVGVEDAASLQLQCGGEMRVLRLASVRAPRPGNALTGGEPYGTQGRDLARGWFVGRRVEVSGGTARLGGEDLRHGLLSLGLVEWSGSAATSADAPLRAAAREARLASRGLWSYDAWRRHQSTVREPLLVPGVPIGAPEPLGAVAARYARKTPAERRAAFEAAVSRLEALPAATAAPDPRGAAKPEARPHRARRPRSSQPR